MAVIESVFIFLCQLAVAVGKTCYNSYYSYTSYCYSTYNAYCCSTGCCYYYDDYNYSSAGRLAGIIVGILIGVGVLVAVIIAIICICRRQQRFAGRVMTPATAAVSVVHTAQPGPLVMYPQTGQPVNPGMSPPPYSAPPPQQAAFIQPPAYSSNQMMSSPPPTQFPQPTSSPQNSYQPTIQQEAQTKSAPPFPEPKSENVYEEPDQNHYQALEGNRENHTYGNPYQSAYQNQGFAP